jgi:hypothetical protein
MHYKIAIGKDSEKLADNVNELIEKGYEPVGGIAVEAVQDGTTLRFNLYQGMINKDRDSSGKEGPEAQGKQF